LCHVQPGIEPLTTSAQRNGAVRRGDLHGRPVRWGNLQRRAWFTEATFSGTAWFDGATFTGDTWFTGATVTGTAWFNGAAISGLARFDKTTFSGQIAASSAAARPLDRRRSRPRLVTAGRARLGRPSDA
jgi:hypothetical protein